jgi:hypothetical protein
MNICINKSLPEFQDLLKETGLKENILTAKIAVWQVNNKLETFPTIEELSLEKTPQKVTKEVTQERKRVGEITIPPSRKLKDKNLATTDAFVQDFIASFNGLLYRKIYTEDLGITFIKKFLTDSATFSEVYKEIVGEIKSIYENIVRDSYEDFLNEELSQEERQGAFEDMEVYLDLINEFDKLVNLAKRHFEAFGITFNAEESMTEDEKDSKDSVELWQTEQIKVNPKIRASSVVRFLISSLETASNIETPTLILDNYKPADFGKISSTLLNNLAGVTTLEEGIATLENLRDSFEESDPDLSAVFYDLIEKLLMVPARDENGEFIRDEEGNVKRIQFSGETIDKFSKDHLRFIIEFFSYLNNNFNNYIIVQTGRNGKVILFDTNLAGERQKLKTEARKNFALKNAKLGLLQGSGTQQVFNKNRLADLFFQADSLDQSGFVDEEIINSKEQKFETVKLFFGFFGFNIPDISYAQVPDTDLENLYDAAYSLYLEVKNKKVESFYIDETDYDGYLNRVVDFIISRDPSQYENSHTRAGGERIFNIGLHSTFSRIVNAINRATSLEELQRTEPYLFTEYSKNSQVLKRGGIYFDSYGKRREGVPFKFQFLEEIGIIEGGKNNKEYAKASPRSKLMANFNATLNNAHPIFRQGDNQLQRLLKYASPLYVTGEKVKVEYLIDEIDHILFLIHGKDENSKVNRYKGIDYSNIDFFISKYPMLDILFNSTADLVKNGRTYKKENLKKLILENKVEEINNLLTDSGNVEKIQIAFDSFMSEKAEILLNKMLSEGVVTFDGDLYYLDYLYDKNREIDATSVSKLTRSGMLNLLKEGIINQFYSDIEVSKLFAGPFIFYEDSDKLLQRMAGLVGTKTILMDSPLANKVFEKLEEKPVGIPYWKKNLYNTEFLDEIPQRYQEYQSLDEEGNIIIDGDTEGNALIKLLVSADPNSVSYMLDTLKNPKIVGIITDAYESMDEGDAFAWASLETYKKLFERAGMWSEAQEKLYQWYNRPYKNRPLFYRNSDTGQAEIINSRNEIRNADGSLVVFTVAKPQHFGNLVEEGFPPGMHKLSVMPILPEYIEQYPSFATIQKTLDQNNVGLLLFPTANKIGTAVNEQGQVPSTYKPKEGKVRQGGEAVVDISDATVQYTFAKNWGIQLSTGTGFKTKVTTGTQLAKLIFSNIYENGGIKEGKEVLASLGEELLLINQSLIEVELENLINRFGISYRVVDGEEIYNIENKEDLINFLIEEVSKRDIPISMIESLEIVRDNADLSDALRFDILPNREKLENILAAIADSRVISRKTNGSSKVQASSTFFEVDGIRRYANDQAQLLSGTLKFYEEGVMEVMLPHWFKEYFSRAIGVDVEEINLKELHSKIEEVAPELLKVVGFRIPTSGLNSVEAIKIAGFLPESAGETIVVPAEIVAKAGSDFDVDKLNLFFANYRFNYETGLPEYVKFINPEDYKIKDGKYNTVGFLKELKKVNKIEEENFISDLLNILPEDQEALRIELVKLNSLQALENRRLEIMHKVVSSEKNRQDVLESIGIELLKEQEERVRAEQGIPDSKKTARDVFADVAYKAEVDVRNIDSKKLTGVASLHVVDLSHAQRYGYKVQIGKGVLDFFGEEELKKLGIKIIEEKLKNGEIKKYANVSLGRQTNVDGLKISTILNQSVNAAVDGVKNPIFYNLNLTLETSSVAFLLMRAGFSLNKIFDLITHPAVRRLTKELENNQVDRNKAAEDVLDSFKEENLTEEQLKEYANAMGVYNNLHDGAAKNLNTYIQNTRIDTQAGGKNTTQLELILHGVETVASGQSGIINAEKIYMPGGFLHSHYLALNSFKRIFSELFLVQDTSVKNVSFSSAYSHMLDYIVKNMTYSSLDNKTKLLDSFKSYLITQIVLTAPNIRLKNFQTDRPLNTNIDLISGENSVPKRVDAIKKVITDNPFLNILYTNIGAQGYKITKKGKVENATNYDTVYVDSIYPIEQRFDSAEIDQMQDAFREMFEDPIIRKTDPNLPYDIVQMMFLQGGLQNSPLSLLKFVPPEIYMEFIYKAYESLYFDNSQPYATTSDLLMNFLAANYNNPNIFRFVSEQEFQDARPEYYPVFITTNDPIRKVNKIFINATKANQLENSGILIDYIKALYPNEKGFKEIQSNTIIDFKNNSYIVLPTSGILKNPNQGELIKTSRKFSKQAYSIAYRMQNIVENAENKKNLPSIYFVLNAQLVKEVGKENVKSFLRAKPQKRNLRRTNQRNKSCRGK